MSLRKQPNLPFRRPNAHSMTIRADESLNPKNCSFSLDPPFTNSFVKVGLLPSKKIYVICFIESPLKVMKNAFYFILKALFVLKIFTFLS